MRTYCAYCLQTCALSTRLNNNRSIRFVSKPPLMDFVHLQGGGRRRRERERKKKGRGVVNKSLVIGLWDQQWLVSVIAIQRAYDRGSFFFFFFVVEKSRLFLRNETVLGKRMTNKGATDKWHDRENWPQTNDFSFLFFLIKFSTYRVHASLFKSLKFETIIRAYDFVGYCIKINIENWKDDCSR